jgi:hypothetical protein
MQSSRESTWKISWFVGISSFSLYGNDVSVHNLLTVYFHYFILGFVFSEICSKAQL